MSDTGKIAKIVVKSAASGESVSMESFWANSPCVINFMRRFGCAVCRLGARQLSSIKPKLDAHGVRLIGIGLEDLGVEEFVDGNYFMGELYIDTNKSSYDALGFKRYSWLSIFPALLAKKSRDAIYEVRQESIEGNLRGDGLQTGGLLIISKGGDQVLYSFKQDNFADFPDPNEILSVLGLSSVDNENIPHENSSP